MRQWKRLLQTALVVASGLILGFHLVDVIECLQTGVVLPTVLRQLFGLPKLYETNPMRIVKLDSRSSPLYTQDNLVLVGVMTAQKYLDSRALAVNRTWAKFVPGRVAFFSSEDSETNYDLPIVRLKDVDDSYPPQKKSFMMLKYMWENYGSYFEWFLRADDDLYVNGEKLGRFLRSLNSSKPQYIGQAGMESPETAGKLSLELYENYCMGGPGVILSRETLRRLVPHIDYCLNNMYSSHEDVEVGRCIRRFVGISCTWSYEMQKIMFHHFSKEDYITERLKSEEVHRAITLHPLKQQYQLYTLHNYLMGLKIQKLSDRILSLHRQLYEADVHEVVLSEDEQQYLGNTSVLGLPISLNKFVPRNENEVGTWDYMSNTVYSYSNSNPRRKIESSAEEGLQDVVRELMESLNGVSKIRGRIIEFKKILYGFTRLNPQHGQDYILDGLFLYKKYRGRKMSIPVRKHVYLHRAFTKPQVREISETSSSLVFSPPVGFLSKLFSFPTKPPIVLPITVHFILPLSGRFEEFQRFLKNYEEVCLKRQAGTSLVIVFFADDAKDTTKNTLDLVYSTRSKYRDALIKVLQPHGSFSRAQALDVGSYSCPPDSLLFFVDVDIMFTPDSLERIRMNTQKGRQAYFPIVYSEFDPSVVHGRSEHFQVDEYRGYWRHFGFGIVSIFKKDLKLVGGLDISIKGWGKEDVDLYEKVVKSKLSVFRAPDVGLVHVFHKIHCKDVKDKQREMCRKSRASTHASTLQIANMILTNQTYLEFAKRRQNRAGS